ncbi:CBS domain-containing protein [Desulfosediminicola flagellatus]|uniref:CBS domain-containing protein n=1 Tax=Desulfosediminicola flagellatus TaxID=2569541 RepID=UPI0010AD0CE4|nr:CBS domain-containing protein [Desulfosediminicola flagellatus]
MFVSERMSTDLITASPDLRIAQARNMMLEKRIRHLPVIDEKGLLLGMVSDRDMRSAMPSTLLDKADHDRSLEKIMNFPISKIMTKEPVKIYGYYTMQDVLLIMRKYKVGAVPVVDEEGFLKGILSTRDLLSAFVDVMGIDEPGTLLCILSDEKQGQMKKIVDIITAEKISLGSVLVSKSLELNRKAVFPYLLTNNVVRVKERIIEAGFELTDPMQWYFKQLPQKE